MAVTEEQDGWRWHVPGGEAFLSRRSGGVSLAPWDSCNVGLHVGDEPELVVINRAKVATRLGLDAGCVAGVSQVHGADVWFDLGRAVTLPDAVRWDAPAPSQIEADALVTTREGVALAIGVADCLPIALVLGDAVAGIHAGWCGLAGGVIEATIAALRRAAGTSAAVAGAVPRALIGPGICASCMEVGEEVAAAFDPSVVRRPAGASRPFLDARADAQCRLEAAGFEVEHVTVCTVEDPRLFSHRGDHGVTGRQALLVRRAG